MDLLTIYQGVSKIIEHLIRKEFRDQGHYLTGNAESSLETRISARILSGYAASYVLTLNEGLAPEQISFKMLPGLIRYFRLRGYQEADAKRIAQATILRQMREGMSTQASKRFSNTGGRQHFIEAAFLYPDIDHYMDIMFDFAIDEEYHRTKTETI